MRGLCRTAAPVSRRSPNRDVFQARSPACTRNGSSPAQRPGRWVFSARSGEFAAVGFWVRVRMPHARCAANRHGRPACVHRPRVLPPRSGAADGVFSARSGEFAGETFWVRVRLPSVPRETRNGAVSVRTPATGPSPRAARQMGCFGAPAEFAGVGFWVLVCGPASRGCANGGRLAPCRCPSPFEPSRRGREPRKT
jgi:hypothetical protein